MFEFECSTTIMQVELMVAYCRLFPAP